LGGKAVRMAVGVELLARNCLCRGGGVVGGCCDKGGGRFGLGGVGWGGGLFWVGVGFLWGGGGWCGGRVLRLHGPGACRLVGPGWVLGGGVARCEIALARGGPNCGRVPCVGTKPARRSQWTVGRLWTVRCVPVPGGAAAGVGGVWARAAVVGVPGVGGLVRGGSV